MQEPARARARGAHADARTAADGTGASAELSSAASALVLIPCAPGTARCARAQRALSWHVAMIMLETRIHGRAHHVMRADGTRT